MFLMHPHADWQIAAECGSAEDQPRNAASYLSLSVMEWAPFLIAILAVGPKAKVTTFANQIERLSEISSNPVITELQLMVPPSINGTATWQLHNVLEVYGQLEAMPPMVRTHLYVLENGRRIGYRFPEVVEIEPEYLDLLYARKKGLRVQ
ncbi:MAG: hypothetical protein V4709_09315 [Pseudomonadota bacterium]